MKNSISDLHVYCSVCVPSLAASHYHKSQKSFSLLIPNLIYYYWPFELFLFLVNMFGCLISVFVSSAHMTVILISMHSKIHKLTLILFYKSRYRSISISSFINFLSKTILFNGYGLDSTTKAFGKGRSYYPVEQFCWKTSNKKYFWPKCSCEIVFSDAQQILSEVFTRNSHYIRQNRWNDRCTVEKYK